MENRILEKKVRDYLRTGKMRNLKGERYEREEGVCYCVSWKRGDSKKQNGPSIIWHKVKFVVATVFG